jgi:hypothetical protein
MTTMAIIGRHHRQGQGQGQGAGPAAPPRRLRSHLSPPRSPGTCVRGVGRLAWQRQRRQRRRPAVHAIRSAAPMPPAPARRRQAMPPLGCCPAPRSPATGVYLHHHHRGVCVGAAHQLRTSTCACVCAAPHSSSRKCLAPTGAWLCPALTGRRRRRRRGRRHPASWGAGRRCGGIGQRSWVRPLPASACLPVTPPSPRPAPPLLPCLQCSALACIADVLVAGGWCSALCWSPPLPTRPPSPPVARARAGVTGPKLRHRSRYT